MLYWQYSCCVPALALEQTSEDGKEIYSDLVFDFNRGVMGTFSAEAGVERDSSGLKYGVDYAKRMLEIDAAYVKSCLASYEALNWEDIPQIPSGYTGQKVFFDFNSGESCELPTENVSAAFYRFFVHNMQFFRELIEGKVIFENGKFSTTGLSFNVGKDMNLFIDGRSVKLRGGAAWVEFEYIYNTTVQPVLYHKEYVEFLYKQFNKENRNMFNIEIEEEKLEFDGKPAVRFDISMLGGNQDLLDVIFMVEAERI